MKRSLLALSLIMGLLIPINSNAANVAGTSCKKLGQTTTTAGVKYTCVKSGKKLVWNKGVKVAAPAPTPKPTVSPTVEATPTPVATPTPIATPNSSVPLTANEKIYSQAFVEVNSNLPVANPKIRMEYIIEDSVLPENRRLIAEQGEAILKAYSGYFFGIDRITIVEISTQAWGLANIPKIDAGNQNLLNDMKNTLPRMNPDSPDCKTGGAGGGFSISYLDHPVLVLTTLNCPLGAQIPLAHELTHAVQTWMDKKVIPTGDVNPACFGPSWLREGQPQVGSMTLSYWNGKSQGLVAYKEIVLGVANPSTKSSYMTFLEENDPSNQQYLMGGMASLYLIAKYGWKKSLDVWTESARLSGSCAGAKTMENFRKAFKNIYGFELSAFYDEVTPYLQYIHDNKLEVVFNIDAAPQPAGTVRIQLTEGCHAGGASSTLQIKKSGAWVDLADKVGLVNSNCVNSTQPWTYAKVAVGDELRWKVFVPGAWDWFSTPYIYKG